MIWWNAVLWCSLSMEAEHKQTSDLLSSKAASWDMMETKLSCWINVRDCPTKTSCDNNTIIVSQDWSSPPKGAVITVTVAAHIIFWCCCLHRAKVARTLIGHPTTWSESEGEDKPETILNDSQQEGHLAAIEGRNIANYDPDIDYEGSVLEAEPVA